MRSDGSRLLRALNSTFDVLNDLNRPVVNSLRPGLTREQVSAGLRNIDLTASEELINLYSWRNGTEIVPGKAADDFYFFPGYYFVELSEAVDEYLARNITSFWNDKWFPIFSNNAGDFYVAELSLPEKTATPIVEILIGETVELVRFHSLVGMIETLAECFKSKIFFVGDHGYLDMDDEKYEAVAKKHSS